MSPRHRSHAKRRRRGVAALALGSRPAVDAAVEAAMDAAGAPPGLTEPALIDIDRLVPELGAGSNGAGLSEPPALIVEGPEGAARRRARDARDGVETSDPRRGPLYVAIAVFVALLVFGVLTLLEMREVPASLAP